MSTENLHSDYGTNGTILVGADSDGYGGYVRGIAGDGPYVALTGATSRTYKTLAGAKKYMAYLGYDAYGRRVQ
jgi:hypothetical protein